MKIEDDTFEFIIEKLTKLLIEQEFEDKNKGRKTYVKKTQCYKNLIKLFKQMKEACGD